MPLLDVAFGSKISLKNMGWGGGLLHSHVQTYPIGSGQQQVTCYHYKDNNNEWNVMPRWDEPPYNPNGPIKFLAHGDVIRLVHVPTTRNLHSHSVVAPVTKLNWEVSGYGNETIGDKHDYWVVEVVDDIKRGRDVKKYGRDDERGRIHSLTTRLRLRHEDLGCYLRAANSILPQWGFKQVEVSCDKANNPRDAHTYWNVESHSNDRREPVSIPFSPLIANMLSSSPSGRHKVLSLCILARLLAPQRGNDDLQQCAYPRSRQGRHSGLQTVRLAVPSTWS